MFHLKFVVNNRYNYDVQWITLLNTVNIFDRVSVRFNVTILYSLRDLKKNGELTSPWLDWPRVGVFLNCPVRFKCRCWCEQNPNHNFNFNRVFPIVRFPIPQSAFYHRPSCQVCDLTDRDFVCRQHVQEVYAGAVVWRCWLAVDQNLSFFCCCAIWCRFVWGLRNLYRSTP